MIDLAEMRVAVYLFIAAGLCAAQPGQSVANPKKNPLAGNALAIENGKARFREACAACHGANAEGGRGPNLVESENLRSMNDEKLFDTVRQGIPGGGMPAFSLTDERTWELVAFIRDLSTPAAQTNIRGDSAAGEVLFFKKANCSQCHMIRGNGGYLGPDLTNIAGINTVNRLREGILRPNARIEDGFGGVTVVLRDGEHVRGIAKNHSNYSIQVLDANGHLHLLDKTKVKEVIFDQKSLMPETYATSLTEKDVDDIIAFLSQQVIRKNAPAEQRDQVVVK